MYCAPEVLSQVSQAANDGWEALMDWCGVEMSRDHYKRVMWQPVLLRLFFLLPSRDQKHLTASALFLRLQVVTEGNDVALQLRAQKLRPQ